MDCLYLKTSMLRKSCSEPGCPSANQSRHPQPQRSSRLRLVKLLIVMKPHSGVFAIFDTRPNIAFAMNRACQFLHNLTDVHMAVVKRTLRYIQGTSGTILKFQRSSSLVPSAFSNADCADCPDDRRSMSNL
jgi:hypothetical protein